MSAASARSGERFSRPNVSGCDSPELRLASAKRSGDLRERAALIEQFMPLAKSLAWRFQTSRASHDDLVQVASLGLVKAVDRFDPERGLRFSSFAVPTIQGELRRYLRDRTWRLHVPRALQELIVALGLVTDAMSGELQRSPTVAELAERMGVSPEAILDARQSWLQPVQSLTRRANARRWARVARRDPRRGGPGAGRRRPRHHVEGVAGGAS